MFMTYNKNMMLFKYSLIYQKLIHLKVIPGRSMIIMHHYIWWFPIVFLFRFVPCDAEPRLTLTNIIIIIRVSQLQIKVEK